MEPWSRDPGPDWGYPESPPLAASGDTVRGRGGSCVNGWVPPDWGPAGASSMWVFRPPAVREVLVSSAVRGTFVAAAELGPALTGGHPLPKSPRALSTHPCHRPRLQPEDCSVWRQHSDYPEGPAHGGARTESPDELEFTRKNSSEDEALTPPLLRRAGLEGTGQPGGQATRRRADPATGGRECGCAPQRGAPACSPGRAASGPGTTGRSRRRPAPGTGIGVC